MEVLRHLVTFEETYFSFSYFEEKDKKEDVLFKLLVLPIQTLSKTFMTLDKLLTTFTYLPAAQLCASLARLFLELELYIRVKSVMFGVYRDSLFRAYDDSKLRFEVETKRRLFQSGPQMANQMHTNFKIPEALLQHREWSEEFLPLRDHFVLELHTLELLQKNRFAGLRQDHLSAVITMNQIRECFDQNHTKFFDQKLLNDVYA